EEEASHGTKKILIRKGKKLAVKIPPGVKKNTVVRLSNARQTTDNQPGDILIQIKIR
ncbi:DnaJ C-terminal domain-containing protein, partial [Chloroflexota bacterium]